MLKCALDECKRKKQKENGCVYIYIMDARKREGGEKGAKRNDVEMAQGIRGEVVWRFEEKHSPFRGATHDDECRFQVNFLMTW